ncbi:hypothetical protein DF3PA_80042 [Candidatus Defluviicoccus seviourii]|uniref:Uncharacterized protein n=1 Tax=Candidatus Defluviicoccus seviourii TaxID=2565273 RepID=A0A564WHF8_9PROT|nr:hypothetical protein DF3PA_80042 [Candidatus Defluviicoccus seviourii]
MSLSMDLQMLQMEIAATEPLFVDATKLARWVKRLSAAADRANAQERSLALAAEDADRRVIRGDRPRHLSTVSRAMLMPEGKR